jgi:hypothetical protein
VLNRLVAHTKHTQLITILIPPHQIILSQHDASFQVPQKDLYPDRIIKALYIELTLNTPFWCRPQMNLHNRNLNNFRQLEAHENRAVEVRLSFISLSLMCATLATSMCHKVKLCPTSPHRKEMFNGVVLKTNATKAFFQRVIAYSNGY